MCWRSILPPPPFISPHAMTPQPFWAVVLLLLAAAEAVGQGAPELRYADNSFPPPADQAQVKTL